MPRLSILSAIAALFLLSTALPAAEKKLPPKMLADFEDAQAVRWQPSEAEAARAAQGSNHALEITTHATATYPSVTITPRQGMWDLSGYEAAEVEVSNPQAHEVRVLLAINNPGADGVNHCNVESAVIKAHGKGKVTVPFGVWHGSGGHDLDLKKIVSVAVLLDKPGKSHHFIVDNIRAVMLDTVDMDAVRADPFFQQLRPAFGRGINFGNALDAPKEGEWGVRLKAEYFTAIKKAGFELGRIPIRWSAHAAATAPYKIDPDFFARVDWAIQESLKNRLVPVVNMHHYMEIFENPDAHRQRFVALWRQIAEHYQSQPAAVVFELLNEPNGKLTSEKWNPLLAETLRVVRRSNPTRQVVVGPTSWNSINDLPLLELPEADRRLVVTVHYYSPFQFTHQGADFAGPQARGWLGTKWIGTAKERKAVEGDFNKAVAWAVAHKRPIYLGEFGSYERADMDSRARWTRFVVQAALERKMGFAYWEFCSGFGAYDPNRDAWREPLKDALVK